MAIQLGKKFLWNGNPEDIARAETVRKPEQMLVLRPHKERETFIELRDPDDTRYVIEFVSGVLIPRKIHHHKLLGEVVDFGEGVNWWRVACSRCRFRWDSWLFRIELWWFRFTRRFFNDPR